MKKALFGLILASLMGLQGCSAVMAISGTKAPNLAVVSRGQSRGAVESQPLRPISTEVLNNGNTVALYQYTVGDEPSPGRAVIYILLDGMTFFLSEFITMPIELAHKGEVRIIKVEYSPAGEIVRVG